ncbi:aminopeptidase N-like isoform X2 [Pectinophora gossypiella]|uniref:aminopeptidase N-like isoform X2 n=1 Tax=Pectinophora gossypiella TaxID=13191 RepID=UPI00214E65DC|nr:aminopeptidase N-like isoform X2 [Pectinophora gossypiella]
MLLRLFVLVLISLVVSNHSKTLSQQDGNFWDETEPFGQTGPPSPNLRLPSDIVPSFYRLKIKADLETSNFTGEVYITIRASRKVKEIILHSKSLSIKNNAKLTEQIYEKVETLHMRRKRDAPDASSNSTKVETENVIQNQSEAVTENTTENVTTQAVTDTTLAPSNTPEVTPANVTETTVNPTTETVKPNTTTKSDTHTQVTHSSVRNIKIISISAAAGDRLVLTLASALKPDVDYILELSFEGPISNSLTGFYKSTYTNANKEEKQLGVTQFEPTYARAAFPCFDEPGFKAKFEISIAHRTNTTVLSNMKIATQEAIPNEPDWEWTHFERSVNMSTYLVAYILCDFKSLDTSYVSKDNITKPIRIWTRPELINKAKYAALITPKLLEYYEEVFGVPYALDKLDLIAIPDFSSGAMENWGLITFRETTLLFDEADSVPRDKQNVAIDIAHELAHQWFGNLVTMQWWTDLWLNEGFATYIEYVGVDHIEPEWNMFESFTRDMLDLLRTDALKNTSPVSRQVVDASEISQKFDEISYTKGANLIRMLNNTMSEELFHKGLVNYLNRWKYMNAEENDLWAAMSSVVASDPVLKGRSLVDFMNSWTRQAGYPVVNVKRNYESGNVHFEQQLFTSSKEPYEKMLKQLWQIPISYTAVEAPLSEWSTKPKLWLMEKSTSADLPINASQALYVNIGATGYYRVNYDQRNWELLSTALKSGHVKSAITKAQLIDDAFNLAKASQLNYSYALGLTTYVINGEQSKIVWDLLLNNMAFLKHNLMATSGYRYFQDYMRIILRKQLERLNFGLDKPKDDNEAFLIENLVMWECYVESPRCLKWAKEQFNNWTSQADISKNPIPSYLRSLVYNVVLKYGGRNEFEFLWNLFQNSTDPNVKTLVITNLPSTRDESLITMMLEKSLTEIPKQYAVAVWSVEPPIGTRIAQRFLLDNFDRVYSKFTEMDAFMFPAVLSGAFGFITNEEELDRLKSFALAHKERLLPMSQTLQKIVDTAQLRINWMKKHAAGINTWLQDYVTSNTTGTVNSTVVDNETTKDLPSTSPIPDSTEAPKTTAGVETTTFAQADNTTDPIAKPSR